MGRWAQQHRRGGGGSNCLPFLYGNITNDASARVNFLVGAPIDAADFDATKFRLLRTGEIGDSVSQGDTNDINVDAANWGGDIFPGDVIEYTGTTPFICTPQFIVLQEF